MENKVTNKKDTSIIDDAKKEVETMKKNAQKATKKVVKEANELNKEVKVKSKKIKKETKEKIEEFSKDTEKIGKEVKIKVEEIRNKTEEILNDVEDTTKKYTKRDIEDGQGLAIVAYILPFIPYFTEKKNKFVMYHARQGMDLLVITMAYYILTSLLVRIFQKEIYIAGNLSGYTTPSWLSFIIAIGFICLAILAVIGIVYAISGKAKELPIVNKIKIFK